MRLIAVGDGLAKIAWFSPPRSNGAPINWHTRNIAELSGSMLPNRRARHAQGAPKSGPARAAGCVRVRLKRTRREALGVEPPHLTKHAFVRSDCRFGPWGMINWSIAARGLRQLGSTGFAVTPRAIGRQSQYFGLKKRGVPDCCSILLMQEPSRPRHAERGDCVATAWQGNTGRAISASDCLAAYAALYAAAKLDHSADEELTRIGAARARICQGCWQQCICLYPCAASSRRRFALAGSGLAG
jgi:hypothetical protein